MNNNFTDIIKNLKKFRDDRDWKQFHDPKNLAEAVSIESAELLEHFLWKNKEEVEHYIKNKENKVEVAKELADTIAYLLLLADTLQIDIEETILNKIKENSLKYPIEKAKGKATKYTKL